MGWVEGSGTLQVSHIWALQWSTVWDDFTKTGNTGRQATWLETQRVKEVYEICKVSFCSALDLGKGYASRAIMCHVTGKCNHGTNVSRGSNTGWTPKPSSQGWHLFTILCSISSSWNLLFLLHCLFFKSQPKYFILYKHWGSQSASASPATPFPCVVSLL